MNGFGVLIVIAATLVGLLMLPVRRTRIPGALLVGLVVLFNARILWRDARASGGFEKAETGSSVSDVRALMGTPQRETDGTISVYGDKKEPNELVPGCVRELWYVEFWVPSQYALCFDRNARLLSKYHYASY